MKQKHYRVYIYPKSNGICNELAMWAVKSNGTPDKAFTLPELEMIFKMDVKKFPTSNEGFECHLFDNSLTVDYTGEERNPDTGKYEKKTTCALMIEQVELICLEPEQPPYELTETEY